MSAIPRLINGRRRTRPAENPVLTRALAVDVPDAQLAEDCICIDNEADFLCSVHGHIVDAAVAEHTVDGRENGEVGSTLEKMEGCLCTMNATIETACPTHGMQRAKEKRRVHMTDGWRRACNKLHAFIRAVQASRATLTDRDIVEFCARTPMLNHGFLPTMQLEEFGHVCYYDADTGVYLMWKNDYSLQSRLQSLTPRRH